MSVAIPAAGAGSPPLAGWTRLELEGRKLLVARGRAVIERWSAPELVSVTSELRALGVRREHRAWTEPDPVGGPGRWLEVAPGRRAKVHRFDPCRRELRVVSYVPAPGASSRWRFERLDRVDAGEAAAAPASDPWALLAHLEELAEPGRHEIDVLTRSGVRHFAVTTTGPRRERWSLQALGERRSRRRYTLETMRAAIAPADGGETLLGLSGPTVLTIDRASGALLAIEGERKGVPGRIRLTLRRWSSVTRPRVEPPWDAFAPPPPEGGASRVDAPARVP